MHAHCHMAKPSAQTELHRAARRSCRLNYLRMLNLTAPIPVVLLTARFHIVAAMPPAGRRQELYPHVGYPPGLAVGRRGCDQAVTRHADQAQPASMVDRHAAANPGRRLTEGGFRQGPADFLLIVELHIELCILPELVAHHDPTYP
jgi:hypothetical protein